jgi:hypothetical protein
MARTAIAEEIAIIQARRRTPSQHLETNPSLLVGESQQQLLPQPASKFPGFRDKPPLVRSLGDPELFDCFVDGSHAIGGLSYSNEGVRGGPPSEDAPTSAQAPRGPCASPAGAQNLPTPADVDDVLGQLVGGPLGAASHCLPSAFPTRTWISNQSSAVPSLR